MQPVDIVNTVYKPFFSIRLVHKSYSDPNDMYISNDISIVPDADTESIFSSYRILYRFYHDTLVCFLWCDVVPVPGDDPKNVPHIKFTDPDTRIRFLLKASAAFLGRTSITSAGVEKIYQFSNRSNAGTDMTLTASASGVDIGTADLKDISLVDPAEKCLAVIDIYTGNVTGPGYALLDTNGRLVDNQPEYKITFKRKT